MDCIQRKVGEEAIYNRERRGKENRRCRERERENGRYEERLREKKRDT